MALSKQLNMQWSLCAAGIFIKKNLEDYMASTDKEKVGKIRQLQENRIFRN